MVADVYRLSRDTLAVREMRRRKPIKRVCLAPARYCAAQLAWKKPGAAEYGFVASRRDANQALTGNAPQFALDQRDLGA